MPDESPSLGPEPLGLRRSFGFGDRLGLATPGHIEAVSGHSFAPVFAQQSIREIVRLGRSTQEVMDRAVTALEASGWSGAFGADGDHLESRDDVTQVAAAGYTLFTIDPSKHVICAADGLAGPDLDQQLQALAAAGKLEAGEAEDLYLAKAWNLDEGITLCFDDPLLLKRAVLKYAGALAHARRMQAWIQEDCGDRPFELELSVDETESATTPLEHFYIGLELRRMQIPVVSLAPRFVGVFEKGIDYIGDIKAFEEHYRLHAAIASYCGPYKLSIHSGSDKFRLYPLIARLSGPHLHVKTSGTSYLEALRVACRVDTPLFREIVAAARDCFEADRRGYQISTRLGQVPAEPSDADLEELYLDMGAGRQILHVTYGSVLGSDLKDRLLSLLEAHDDLHTELLARHLGRHIQLLQD